MSNYIIRDWHDEAACKGHPDPDLWHYENTRFEDEQKLQVLRSVEALDICNTCPVKAQCLQQGLEDENLHYDGGCGTIWGGLLMSERLRLSKRQVTHRKIIGEARHLKDVRKIVKRAKV